MILLIDHYDSFTYNLYQLIGELGKTVRVVRYDEITIEAIEEMEPEAIILSPGPGTPLTKTNSLEIVRALYHRYPMLGVCLGHQIIAAAFGANIVKAQSIKHGKTSLIEHNGTGPFSATEGPISVMRYHSLAVSPQQLHEDLEIIATAKEDDEIMALRHKRYPVYGFQFHPESIGTKDGKKLMAQFFRSYRKTTTMRAQLAALSEGKDLSYAEIEETVDEILQGNITDSELAAFLMGLKAKGETVDEITALVDVLRKNATAFTQFSGNILDNCGTGGDGAQSFNVSTTAAFVLAGAGVKIAKHGNRSVSSKTGSADVLEHLSVALDFSVDETAMLLEKNNISFLFAPFVHPKIKHVMKVRRDLKIPTIFNMIGPLINPVPLETQLVGIYRRDMLHLTADVLHKMGRKRAVVINGAGFVDEATLAGENHLVLLEDGKKTDMILTPEDVGLTRAPLEAIRGGEAIENAEILQAILQGERGAKRDTVLLNAAIALFAYGKAKTIQEGVTLAAHSIDSGAALSKLHYLVDYASTRKQVQV